MKGGGSRLLPPLPRKLAVALGLCAGLAAVPAFRLSGAEAGVRVAAAILETRTEVERETAELNRVRDEIDLQRRPLAERLEILRATVAERRADLARLDRLLKRGENEHAALKNEIDVFDEQNRFMSALFIEYARAMETRVNAAEGPLLAARLRALDDVLYAPENHAPSAGIADLLEIAGAWNRARLGGHVFSGKALDRDGFEHDGHFAVLGPLAWFVAADATVAGPVASQFGQISPSIVGTHGADMVTAVSGLLDGRAAVLPVDVTGGDVINLERARASLFEHARKGGLVMVPLLAVALAAILLTIWKIVELNRFQVGDGQIVVTLTERLREGDIGQAQSLWLEMREPLASLAATAIAHRRAARDYLEEMLHEAVLASMPAMERHLGILAVLGGVAPLLGLLGTVTGMIRTFQLVTIFGSGDARLLSGGISEALTTTAFGLLIAIPVLLAHALLMRKARGVAAALEHTAGMILAGLTGNGSGNV